MNAFVHIFAHRASSKKRGGGVGGIGIVVDHIATLSCAPHFLLERVSRGEDFFRHSLAFIHIQTVRERLHHARRRNNTLAHGLDVLTALREGVNTRAKRVYGEEERERQRRRF